MITTVKRFEMTNGRVPTASEGLQVFVTKPDSPDLPNWKPLLTELPLDQSGQAYHYVVPAPDGAPAGVYSTGADRISRSNGNDPDDVRSWFRGGN
jgi:hypothetical protein